MKSYNWKIVTFGIILLALILNFCVFSFRKGQEAILKHLEYNEESNDSFSAWAFSMIPLMKLIYRVCLETRLVSKMLVFLFSKKVYLPKSQDSFPKILSESHCPKICSLSFWLSFVVLFTAIFASYFIKKSSKRILGIVNWMFNLIVIGLLLGVICSNGHLKLTFEKLYESIQIQKSTTNPSHRPFSSCITYAFIFDMNFSFWSINLNLFFSLLYGLLFLLLNASLLAQVQLNHSHLQKDAFHPLDFIEMIHLLNFGYFSLILGITILLYLTLRLLETIFCMYSELKTCQIEGLLPLTPDSTKEKMQEKVQNSPSLFDDIYLGKIRRQTAKKGKSIKSILAFFVVVVFPWFSIETLCSLLSSHFLLELILKSFVQIRIFWSDCAKKLKESYVERNTSLSERELSKISFDFKKKAFYCISIYTVGCMTFVFIALTISPVNINSTAKNMLFWAKFVFSALIFLLIPILRYILVLRKYSWYATIPEMVVIFFSFFIGGFSLKPIWVMILQLWLFINIYTRFIHTYKEKKLLQPIY